MRAAKIWGGRQSGGRNHHRRPDRRGRALTWCTAPGLQRRRESAQRALVWEAVDKQDSIRRCQYTSRGYATLAGLLDVTLSIERTGQGRDNAPAESYFASLKGASTTAPGRLASARGAIVDYIGWFSSSRPHSALGYLTPNEFEAATGKEALAKVA